MFFKRDKKTSSDCAPPKRQDIAGDSAWQQQLLSLCTQLGGSVFFLHHMLGEAPARMHYLKDEEEDTPPHPEHGIEAIDPEDREPLVQWLSSLNPAVSGCYPRMIRLRQHKHTTKHRAIAWLTPCQDAKQQYATLLCFPIASSTQQEAHKLAPALSGHISRLWHHQLRTAMTTIIGYAEWLAAGGPAYRRDEAHQAIIQSATEVMKLSQATESQQIYAATDEPTSLDQAIQAIEQATPCSTHQYLMLSKASIWLYLPAESFIDSVSSLCKALEASVVDWQNDASMQLCITLHGGTQPAIQAIAQLAPPDRHQLPSSTTSLPAPQKLQMMEALLTLSYHGIRWQMQHDQPHALTLCIPSHKTLMIPSRESTPTNAKQLALAS